MRRGPSRLVATLATAALGVWSNEVPACPLDRLAQQLSNPTGGPSSKEIPAAERESAEGGVWQLRLSETGALVSATRTDFGESGQRQTTLLLLDRHNFAIRSVVLTYRAPIEASRAAEIASRLATDYFYCGDVVYVPVRSADPSDASNAARQALLLRRMFFEASELAPYMPP